MNLYFRRLIHKFKLYTHKQQFKQNVMNETNDLDFTNITHDWEKSKFLYDLLKR